MARRTLQPRHDKILHVEWSPACVNKRKENCSPIDQQQKYFPIKRKTVEAKLWKWKRGAKNVNLQIIRGWFWCVGSPRGLEGWFNTQHLLLSMKFLPFVWSRFFMSGFFFVNNCLIGKIFLFHVAEREKTAGGKYPKTKRYIVDGRNFAEYLNFYIKSICLLKTFSEGVNVKRENSSIERQTLARVWIWLIFPLNFFSFFKHLLLWTLSSVNNTQSGINWFKLRAEMKSLAELWQISIFQLGVWWQTFAIKARWSYWIYFRKLRLDLKSKSENIRKFHAEKFQNHFNDTQLSFAILSEPITARREFLFLAKVRPTACAIWTKQ